MNDQEPVFGQASYAASIVENHVVGTAVGITVQAMDPEVEHTVRYFTEASDAGSRFFSVDQSTGVISLDQNVDYDPPSNHRDFTFRASSLHSTT